MILLKNNKMKNLENKKPSITSRLSDNEKSCNTEFNASFKTSKDDKIIEKIERETTKSVFIKLMYQYKSRMNQQSNKGEINS